MNHPAVPLEEASELRPDFRIAPILARGTTSGDPTRHVEDGHATRALGRLCAPVPPGVASRLIPIIEQVSDHVQEMIQIERFGDEDDASGPCPVGVGAQQDYWDVPFP